ncbi:MAG: hypothetical protein Q9159_004437 [Coniocarpon cinnabarinum]
MPLCYVEYLEEQQQLLVKGLKKSYSLTEASPGALGDDPPVHAILEDLNIFSEFPPRRQRESAFQFEEDLDLLREKCEADLATGSSASTTTSQIVSTEPTPSRLSEEREVSPEIAFGSSRAQTWSPSHHFQPMFAEASGRPRQSSPSISSGQGPFLPQTASAPPSIYETSGAEYYPGPGWQQPPLAQVQSEPTPGPTYYWTSAQHQSQHPPHHHHFQRQQWQPSQTQAEQQFGTVDPAVLMQPSTSEVYLQTAEAWAEYLREQQRRQR